MTRVMIVGYGYWGSKLVDLFAKLVGQENVLIADIDKSRYPQGYKCDSHYSRLLDQADACVVATPPDTHYEIAKACLEAGKPTLVEKPMALKAAHAGELVSLAQAKNLTLMTDDTFLYTDWAKSSFATPQTGFARAVETHWTGPRVSKLPTPPEGILWTLGPHPVSLILTCMGRYPIGVRGRILPRQATVVLEFVGGDEAAMFLQWDTPGRERYLWWAAGPINGHVDFDLEQVGRKEPLLTMCEAFLTRVQTPEPWIDYHGLMVVETLEMMEKPLSATNVSLYYLPFLS